MIVLVALAVPLFALAPVTTAYRHRRTAPPPAPMPLREWMAAEMQLSRARWRGRRGQELADAGGDPGRMGRAL